MSPEKQKEFVHELLREFEKEITTAIDECKVPDDWDGIELRELVHDKARASRGFRFGLHGNAHPGSKRVRVYRNVVLQNNL